MLDGGLHICPITTKSLVLFPVGRTFGLCALVCLLQVHSLPTHWRQCFWGLIEQKHPLWPWTNAEVKIDGASVWQIETSSSQAGQRFIHHPSLRGWCFLPVLCRGRADQFPVWLYSQRHRAQPSSSWPATCTARWTNTACFGTLTGNFNAGWVVVVF